MCNLIKKLLSFILSALLSLGTSIGLIPYRATGAEIDLSRFELAFSDEFDGDSLGSEWRSHHFGMGDTVKRRGSYWNRDLAQVESGQLHIKVKYLPNGTDGSSEPGWYTAGIDTGASYRQKYGYFETRCILPKGAGLWGAFWMFSDGINDSSVSGADGTEIDIFESPYYSDCKNNKISANLHYGGYAQNHRQLVAKRCRVHGNPYEEFNTYGVEWNENGYIFYLNGKEWYRTDFGGKDNIAAVSEYMILSIEIGGKDAVPNREFMRNDLENFESEMIVDYVRAYKYK